MSQENFKLIKKDKLDSSKYSFYEQNPQNMRACTKNKEMEEYCVIAPDSNYVLLYNNKDEALNITLSNQNVDLGKLLETDYAEELINITPENVNDISEEILEKFNNNFSLSVNYNPTAQDIENINQQVKKTTWDKENIFFLNFYMMEVFRLKHNFNFKFTKVETFNPFFTVSLDDGFEGVNFYRYLRPTDRKFFNFDSYLDRLEKITRKWNPLDE